MPETVVLRFLQFVAMSFTVVETKQRSLRGTRRDLRRFRAHQEVSREAPSPRDGRRCENGNGNACRLIWIPENGWSVSPLRGATVAVKFSCLSVDM